jgi:HK97 family phage major capsid protein
VDFEQEITKLREQIRETQGQEAHARSEADALVGRMRESGTDLTAADNFAKVDEAYKSADSLRDDVAGMRERLGRALELAGRRADEAPKDRDAQRDLRGVANLAARLLESDAYGRLRTSGVLNSRNAHVNMDPVEVMTRDEFFATGARFRTTFDNSTNIGSGLLEPDYTRKMIEQFVRRVRLLDVITIGTTDTDTVDYVIENARTDAAAETPYGTAVPESGYGFSHAQTTVKRVGHFYPATKGILADAGQTRTLLDSRLRSGLERRVESQVLAGDGVGENILGIASDTGWGTQALGTDTRIDAVHKAMTVVRLATETGIEPNVIGISPSDYEQVVLQKDANGNYQMANPVNNSAPTIWGLTPVVSTLFTDGTPWVGDFAEAATMWLREGVTLSATDSHADFFLKGLVAVMAETRVAFKLVQPKALCKLTGF